MALQNSDTAKKSLNAKKKAVKANVKQSAQKMSDTLIRKIGSTRDSIHSFVDNIEGYAEQGIKASERKFEYAKDQSDAILSYIDEKPLKSACIAFAAGYLLQKICD